MEEFVQEVKPSPRIYVGHLHQSTSEGDLIRIFQGAGTVKNIEYMWHKHGPLRGVPRGYAFIEMSSLHDAQNAIECFNNMIVRGKKLHVCYCDEKQWEGKYELYRHTAKGKSYSSLAPSSLIYQQSLQNSPELTSEDVRNEKTTTESNSTVNKPIPSAEVPLNSIARTIPFKSAKAVDDKLKRLQNALSILQQQPTKQDQPLKVPKQTSKYQTSSRMKENFNRR
mmetsp:Transcript_30182/g.43115  ORF Transcript_30182/g.43115 Transcript_30182/m.43115 type:complete len:224 (-) Transcript_30182:3542-4213(-)